ncbi:cleavage and polyadenylation specificity factor subunit 3-like [Sycon ciliatum]|uniref:cleavage and polyadenylation specificity factor subunit 3-like n=1 Tax=Sycon ciliatum TaxID=27933 RepID=UPI0020A88798|eukprot:scpid46014/ scgid3691/ Cleavage and polyadenylation specificity factor subunit 3; Cleavage and polyadenylation specificity factor 73 kDa subunit; mRNA 3&apos
MATKRRATSPAPEESDQMTIRPLGAGQEVGRSCIILEFKNKKIMLDCGIHPGLPGLEALPYTDMIDASEIDLVLITHFHLDHCGALPWFLEKTTFRGRVFMTHATKAIYRWLLSDYVKVSNISADQMLYTEKELEASMAKIETVNFHQVIEVGGVKFWCYNAGHVLGAAMFMLEIAGVKILYTGDFSRQEDRHLMAAEIPPVSPDVLIMESTYGTHIHEKRDVREARFTGTIHDILNRGGRCLIPVFALGRAQELLLILDEYWANHPELQEIPIYYASSLAKKCMSVFQTYANAMNERIQRQISVSNPFIFKHISNLKNMEQFDDIGPSVVMASPGMMQSGLSRELFENWCTDRRNGVVIAGYCVEGTLAKHVMSEPEEITTLSGQRLPLKMSVDYVSFSAHVDYEQISEFVRILKPPQVVLVHGEATEMGRLRSALVREYEDNPHVKMSLHTPANTQAVELCFRGEKMAKVVGGLASREPQDGGTVSGILIKRGFKYHLMAPTDLANYTDLSSSVVTQKQCVPYKSLFSLVGYYLRQVAGEVEEIKENGMVTGYKAFKVVTVLKGAQKVVLEWIANEANDMYADAVLSVLMQIEGDTTGNALSVALSNATSAGKYDEVDKFPSRLFKLLLDIFGEGRVARNPTGDGMLVTVDSHEAVISLKDLSVDCADEALAQQVQGVVRRLHTALHPCKAASKAEIPEVKAE